MTKGQELFLELATIKGLPYDQITEETKWPRSKFSPWWNELKVKREEPAAIRKIWRKKC